jgi:nitroreductase
MISVLAPSVGLMQPWRFIRVRDRSLRLGIHALVDEERRKTAHALGEREVEFMRLKVEGILECGEVLVAALAPGREKHVFGRRTMPEMDLASVACAIRISGWRRAPRALAWAGCRCSSRDYWSEAAGHREHGGVDAAD